MYLCISHTLGEAGTPGRAPCMPWTTPRNPVVTSPIVPTGAVWGAGGVSGEVQGPRPLRKAGDLIPLLHRTAPTPLPPRIVFLFSEEKKEGRVFAP